MKKTIFCAALAAVFLFAAACHKNTSSSSAGGSLSAALNDLALVALNSVGGGSQNFPTIGPGCSPAPNRTGNFTTGSPPAQSACPSSSYIPNQTYIASAISLSFSNCAYQGYIFSGNLAFGVAPALSECTLQVNSADVYLAGGYSLTSSSFTISGNGLNASCNSQGGHNGPISLTASGVSYETTPSNTLVGTLTGKGCQTTLSNLKFFWQ